jgi:hypothetical protein
VHYDLPLSASSSLLTWDKGGKTTSELANKCVRLGSHLVVSPDDQDCDGNIDGTPIECEPDVYMGGSRSAIPGEFSCLWPPPQAGQPTTMCFAGGPMCTDGSGQDSTCSKSGYCAPSDLCSHCGANFRCAETGDATATGTPPPQLTRFECAIAVKHDGTLCGDDVALPAGTLADCRNVQLRNDQQNFQPSLEVIRDSATDVVVKTRSQGCTITLTPKGKVDVSAVNGPDQIRALMAVDTGAPDTQQGFIVPIVLNFIVQPQTGGNACGTSTCAAIPDSIVTDSTLCQ